MNPSYEVNKLPKAQEVIARWLIGGWTAYEQTGAIIINGQKRGNLKSMMCLVRKGIAVQGGNCFELTKCPCCNRRAILTSENVCQNCYL